MINLKYLYCLNKFAYLHVTFIQFILFPILIIIVNKVTTESMENTSNTELRKMFLMCLLILSFSTQTTNLVQQKHYYQWNSNIALLLIEL